jgi:hypothetical protein
LADAFPFSNNTNGTTASIAVYLDSSNQASKLLAGLYTNNDGKPGSLIASASLSSPAAGAWNTLTITSAFVGAGSTYWIAVLGEGGTLSFRDRASGPCNSVYSRRSSLRSLPSWWSNGTRSNNCPISAYVNGYLLSPVNTAAPAITGQAVQGQTMSASTGNWTNSPASYGYQWQDCTSSGCANISAATSSSYRSQSSDVGDALDVVVTATNSMGSASAASAETPAVVSASPPFTPPPPPPVNTAPPAISGQVVQGQTLTTSNGSWTNNPTSYAYQWQDCDTSGASCTSINGATSTTYTLAAADVGHTIRSLVTATNAGGSASTSSAATSVVPTPLASPPSNTAAPAISGQAVQGETLTTSNGLWTNNPSSYAYQWRNCTSSSCANISGATSTSYNAQSSDVGNALDVVVTATNSMGSASAASAETPVVISPTVNTSAPANTSVPTVQAPPAFNPGSIMTVSSPGTWTIGGVTTACGSGGMTCTYQWEDCTASGASCSIATTGIGATTSTYILGSGDAEHTIRVAVTAHTAGGSESASSTQTANVYTYLRGVDLFDVMNNDSSPNATMSYLASKGIKLIRLVTNWTTLQPTRQTALSSAYLSKLDTEVSEAGNNGMVVLIDLVGGFEWPTNSGTCCVSEADFTDVWNRLSAHFAGNPYIWGYDLQNEPSHGFQLPDSCSPTPCNSVDTYQEAVIDNLRNSGDDTRIVLETGEYDSMLDWLPYHAGLGTGLDNGGVPYYTTARDSNNFNLEYEGHRYPGTAVGCNSGCTNIQAPADSVNAVTTVNAFGSWCQSYGLQCFVGEFSWPCSNTTACVGGSSGGNNITACDNSTDATNWNSWGSTYYARFDAYNLDATAFSADGSSTTNFCLLPYDHAAGNGASGGVANAIDHSESIAATIQANGSR